MYLYLGVKNSPSMPQKQLWFNADTSVCEFTKHMWQYDLQKKQKVNTLIGRVIVCAMPSTMLQTLAEHCRNADEATHD